MFDCFHFLKLQKFTTDKTDLFICPIVSVFETTKIYYWSDWFVHLFHCFLFWNYKNIWVTKSNYKTSAVTKAKGLQINSSIVWVTIRKIKNMEQMNIYYYRVTIIPWIWSFCPKMSVLKFDTLCSVLYWFYHQILNARQEILGIRNLSNTSQ